MPVALPYSRLLQAFAIVFTIRMFDCDSDFLAKPHHGTIHFMELQQESHIPFFQEHE